MDGQEALERLTEIPRSCVILLDLSMPRINAWESPRRRSIDYKYCYDRFVRLRLPGAKHQLAKPIDLDRLLALLDQYC